MYNGGKGANQAAAVSKLGSRADLLGRVGDDDLDGLLVARR
ncbi:MAG: PfkB family carbohydrate kinase [Rubrobacteraceae bacterium]